MEASAISMMLFGLLITWGGAVICFYFAFKRKKK